MVTIYYANHEKGNYSFFQHKKKIPLFKMSLRIKLKTKFIEPSFRYTPANHKFAVRQSWTVKLNQNITN